MSVLFSFKRSGEIIAAPRVTYSTREVPQQTRDLYRKAITASLDACVPLKFTAGLGGALAGRPIMIRYVDNRDLPQQSGRKGRVVARRARHCASGCVRWMVGTPPDAMRVRLLCPPYRRDASATRLWRVSRPQNAVLEPG